MQSDFSPPGSSMTSGITIDEGDAGQFADVDAKLSRTLERPIFDRPAELPKKTLRERLRRPLLLLFPVILVAVARCIMSPRNRTSRPTMPSSAPRRSRSTPGSPARSSKSPSRTISASSGASYCSGSTRTIPNRNRSGRGAARQCASPNQSAQGDLPAARGGAPIGERYRGLRPA